MTIYKRLITYRLQELPAQFFRGEGAVRTLLGGTVAAIAGLFLSRLLITAAQILIVRQLGVTLYGEYATLMATLGLLAGLLGMGLDTWVLQEGGRNPNSLARNIWQVLFIKAIGSAALLALLALAWSSQVMGTPAFAIGVVGIIFESFARTGYSALRATRRNGLVAVFQTLAPLALLLLLWIMSTATLSVIVLVALQTICSVVVTVALMIHIWRSCGAALGQRFDLRGMIRGSWLFVAADVLSNIYSQSGVVILGMTVGAAAVGIFRPAVSAISFLFLIPSLLFAVGLPLLNDPRMQPGEYRSVVRSMAAVMLLYGAAVLLGIWFAGATLIRVLYGPEYADALPLVKMMSFVPLLKAGSFVAVAVLLSRNQQRLRVMLQSVVVALSLVGGLIVIPRYGAIGATWLYIGIESLLFILYALGAAAVLRRWKP